MLESRAMMSRRRAVVQASCALASIALTSCGNSGAAPRPQLVVVVNTDALLFQQAVDDPTLSSDAAIDTIRIDAIDSAGQIFDLLDVVAPDPRDWPISFGVVSASDQPGQRFRLRIRAFQGRHAQKDTALNESALLPQPRLSIDRVVDVTIPSDGVDSVEVLLSADCFGVTPSFAEPATTCVDAARPRVAVSEGLVHVSDPTGVQPRSGQWAGAQEVSCASSGDADRICIPGGFCVLGDEDVVGIYGQMGGGFDAVPMHPLHVSPFLLDRTEFTVGKFRELARNSPSVFEGVMPRPRSPSSQSEWGCTWLGPDDATNDSYPLNCVSWIAAMKVCEMVGGSLPTEAQWEFAARGRGQHRRYPWGQQLAECCTTSMRRPGSVEELCPGSRGPEPVGSHPISAACNGTGDVSRDGVMDLGGSLTELTLDSWGPYTSPCWDRPGVLVDPVCNEAGIWHTMRGGSWGDPFEYAHLALRMPAADGGTAPTLGFRCAYAAGVP